MNKPRCRPCLREKLGGRIQESQQLVKYRPGAAPRMLVEMPLFVGNYNQKYLHQHLPNLFHNAREAGDRVVDPMAMFSQNFQTIGDARWHRGAFEWIFSRVLVYQNYPRYTGVTFGMPDPLNHFLSLYQMIEHADDIGNFFTIEQCLEWAAQLFETVAKVLRSDNGLDFSDRLLEDFVWAATRFLPWLSWLDPRRTFIVVRATYELTRGDPGAIDLLCQSLAGPERADLRAVTANAEMHGDLLAHRISALI